MALRPALLLSLLLLAGCLSPDLTTPPVEGTGPVTRSVIRFETEAGPLTVLLYPEAAPRTVALMEQYVAEGYYVGRSFGRTVPGHVIQVVDAAGGVTDDARRVPLEAAPGFQFSAGAVGIARDADPDSGGPEFFVMDYATSHLGGNYTVWGQVVSDLDVVHGIAARPAVDWPRAPAQTPAVPDTPVGPGFVAGPTDRSPIVPVRITAARLERVNLVPDQLARYPLQVAQNVRSGTLRHSLEWPADLHANATGALTWYVRPASGSAPQGTIEVRDEAGPLFVAPSAPGIYPFAWRPGWPGTHTLSFLHNGTVVAQMQVPVPAQPAAPRLA